MLGVKGQLLSLWLSTDAHRPRQQKTKVSLRLPVPGVQRPVYPNRLVEGASPCYELNTKNLQMLKTRRSPNTFLGEPTEQGKELAVVLFAFWHIGVVQIRDKDVGFSGSLSSPREKTQQPRAVAGWRYLYGCSTWEVGLSCLCATLTCWPSSSR